MPENRVVIHGFVWFLEGFRGNRLVFESICIDFTEFEKIFVVFEHFDFFVIYSRTMKEMKRRWRMKVTYFFMFFNK